MSNSTMAYAHLATVLPAFALGTYLLFQPKGTTRHKALGRLYVALMLVTASVTLAMPAQVGPQVWGHFGFIHIFSLVVLISLPLALHAARLGQLRRHRGHMLGVYIGGLWVAGAFAFMPGRLLHGWLWG